MADVSVSTQVAAPPEVVWALVADATRMGEWSPECTGGEWLDGATGPATGARFTGTNRNGRRRWSTVATITAAEPGRRFAFHVSAARMPVADWAYELEATDGGCRVTESWTDRRPRWFLPVARLATGVADRVAHNRDGMERTLERLAAAAESGSAGT